MLEILMTNYMLYPTVLETTLSHMDRYNSPYNVCACQISLH